MEIQICSDLHLEFNHNRKWLEQNPLIPSAELLIIAGDTYYLERGYSELDFIKRVSKDFKHVFIIPGNHEYYGGFDVTTNLLRTNQNVLENVRIINNDAFKIGNVNFIFSTLWSKIDSNIVEINRGLMDFRKIQYKSRKFTINDFNELHKNSFAFIEKEVSKKGRKIVISHHLPSEKCNVKEFDNSPLNQAFCVEKSRFIADSDIEYWIYGHSHRNKKDFKINNTILTTNQLGYVFLNEHLDFKLDKTINID